MDINHLYSETDSDYSQDSQDSQISIIQDIDKVLYHLKRFKRKRRDFYVKLKQSTETKETVPEIIIKSISTGQILSLPFSLKTDMPTVRNVQTLVGLCMENGFVNENGSFFPLSALNLKKYIEFQTVRMLGGKLSFSSLNWYLQSLRRYCIDMNIDWESARNDPIVKEAVSIARKTSQKLKQLPDEKQHDEAQGI